MIFKSEVFNLNFKNNVAYLTFKKFDELGFIKHCFSTKIGGVSIGDKSSMNLGFKDDNRDHVLENYHRLCDAVGIDFNTLIASSQDHGTFIRTVSKEHCGIGITKPKDIESVDGLMTNTPMVSPVIYFADCVPILFVDTVKKVIGLAHAGWKGSCGLIAQNMINKFKSSYNSNPKDILVGIGPSIGQCCYEIDYPVAHQFIKVIGSNYSDNIMYSNSDKFYLSLQEFNKTILMKVGILEDNIIMSDLCTSCCHELLFSHRATNGKRGTMGAIMQIVN